jgi:Ca2+-binding EF-hand superfamily protein
LRFAFRIYDMDNDGYISNGELFQVLQSYEFSWHSHHSFWFSIRQSADSKMLVLDTSQFYFIYLFIYL